MSTQTFSKVFLFPNNKRKTKNIFPITIGSAHGNELAHGCFRPEQPRGEKGEAAWLRAPAQGRPGLVGAEGRRHAGVQGASAA
jgi:hypothetical protein